MTGNCGKFYFFFGWHPKVENIFLIHSLRRMWVSSLYGFEIFKYLLLVTLSNFPNHETMWKKSIFVKHDNCFVAHLKKITARKLFDRKAKLKQLPSINIYCTCLHLFYITVGSTCSNTEVLISFHTD